MTSSYELAAECARLYADGVRGAALAARIGRSKSWTSRHLHAWQRASLALLKAWQAGSVSDSAVLAIAALPALDQVIALREPHRAVRSAGKRPTNAAIRHALLRYSGHDGYSAGARAALEWVLGMRPAVDSRLEAKP